MMKKPTPLQRRIERGLDVTHAGMVMLAKLKAGRSNVTRGNEAARLIARGLIEQTGPYAGGYAITPAGELLVADARRKGW